MAPNSDLTTLRNFFKPIISYELWAVNPPIKFNIPVDFVTIVFLRLIRHSLPFIEA